MEKRNCPICGAELSREDVFCGNCGTKIQDTEGIPRRITGLIITIAGLFLLLYSFFTAYG
jgi:uncharacterized membrane protein YvbJ